MLEPALLVGSYGHYRYVGGLGYGDGILWLKYCLVVYVQNAFVLLDSLTCGTLILLQTFHKANYFHDVM